MLRTLDSGTVGAALFIAIGNSLRVGGPAALLLGFIVWTSVIFCVAMCQIEMVTLQCVQRLIFAKEEK